jgi:hypothetical protein
MGDRKTALEVLKADGSIEEYLHTKVMATISNALDAAGVSDIDKAQDLAEVITYYLYNDNQEMPFQHPNSTPQTGKRVIDSIEIFSIIKATLVSTGFEQAAVALEEHYYKRKMNRSRIEVVGIDINNLDDAELFYSDIQQNAVSRWNKSRIAGWLINKQGFDRLSARAIASIVEQKVFKLELTRLSASLIKQLVLSETAVMKRAMRQLQTES